MIRISLIIMTALTLMACGSDKPQETEAPTETKADLHSSILTLDSHLDTPMLFHRENYNFANRGSYEADGTNVDLVRLQEGNLDGGFWVIYTQPGLLNKESYVAARTSALLRQMAIREMAAKYSDSVELAFVADDAKRIHDSGKIVVYQSMENAYPLGEDVSLLETFYVGGLRMVGPVHFRNNQFADSATDEPIYGGLSELGKELVKEANRLGLIIDGSHASDQAKLDMMELSTTPIILSHSGPDGVYDHPRNVPDEILLKLAETGGVIHVNAFSGYLEQLTPSDERAAALKALEDQYGANADERTDEQREAYSAALSEVNDKFPRPKSTFEKFMEHLLYTLKLVGADHVGIGADWDGGGGVIGMTDVTTVNKITNELITAGYSAEDIEKIWSGNILRLLRDAEAARTAELTSPNVLN